MKNSYIDGRSYSINTLCKAFVLCLIVLITACSSTAPKVGSGPQGESMSMDQLVQTDFNRTVTMAMRDNLNSLYKIQEKLYKRNPNQLNKNVILNNNDLSRQEQINIVMQANKKSIETATPPIGLESLQDIEVLSVSLNPDYQGDRIAAFIYGMADMILTAHNNKSRFYATDNLDAVSIYNAARNVEIAAWMINNRRDSEGQLLLLSNEMSGDIVNISFEREFGQIIARLDLISNLLDENLRRVGINYMQNLLFFTFLPVR